MPGAFKWDYLETFKPLLFQNSVKFFLPYWGAYSNYKAMGMKLRKRKSPHSETIFIDRTYQIDETTNRGVRSSTGVTR